MTTYSINGGSEIHGVQSRWERISKYVGVDGVAVYNDWAFNFWSMPTMDMTTFETLLTAQGSTLTTLETNDFALLNSGATYSTAILESVVNGSQRGLIMENIEIIFRVDTTS